MKKINTANRQKKTMTSNCNVISVGIEVRQKIIKRLDEINKRAPGINVSARSYIDFLMSLDTEDNIKFLLKSSMSSKFIRELYKKRFFEKFNTRSDEDFNKFIWSDKFSKFKRENKDVLEIF